MNIFPEPLERHRVQDADEEIFWLYVQLQSSSSLAKSGGGSAQTHLCRNIYQCPWANSVSFACGDEAATTVVQVKQNRNMNAELGMTGGFLWDAAIVLTKFLLRCHRHHDQHHRHRDHRHTRFFPSSHLRVLELGAGCGLCGMVCDCVLGVGEVVLTDQIQVLNLLKANVAANDCKKTTVKELVWGERDPLLLPVSDEEKDAYRNVLERIHPRGEFEAQCMASTAVSETQMEEYYGRRWDLILASDCVFNDAHLDEFIQTIRQAYAQGTKIFICSELRDHTVWEKFLGLLMDNFDCIERIDFEPLFEDEMDELPRAVVLYEVSGPLKGE